VATLRSLGRGFPKATIERNRRVSNYTSIWDQKAYRTAPQENYRERVETQLQKGAKSRGKEKENKKD